MNKEVILAHLKTVKESAEVALQGCIERDTKARSKGDPQFKPLSDAYYAHRFDFKKTLPPMPFKLVNYCACEYPMYIIAVPGTVTTVYRGSPQQLDTAEVFTVDPEKLEVYTAFLKKYMPELEDEPSWFLSSYWG